MVHAPHALHSRTHLRRIREIFAEIAWHGDSTRLLDRMGVDEGELADACEVVVLLVEGRLATLQGASQ